MPTKQGSEELLTAAVERGPSEGARSGSKESSHTLAPPLPRPRVARAQETIQSALMLLPISLTYISSGQTGRSSIVRVAHDLPNTPHLPRGSG